MKFPGKRKSRHYFPVTETNRIAFNHDYPGHHQIYVLGIDQLMVDIEASVSDEFLLKYQIKKGESYVYPTELVDKIYNELKEGSGIIGEFPGGSIGNTLHNYSVLSDSRSVVLGVISENISVGDYAFKYICATNSLVDFSYLQAVPGPMGRALSLVTPDRERSFVIGVGVMNEFDPNKLDADVIKKSSLLLVSAYSLRDQNTKMAQTTMNAVKIAHENNIPVVLSLGTSNLVSSRKDFLLDFISKYVNICACNEEEAEALTGESDPLLAVNKILNLCDFSLLTVGPKGLYIGAYVNDEQKRETKDQIHSKSIPEYNAFEYSRAMLKNKCETPIKIFTHINPYMGGPMIIKNTNGAGDAALSALLHDIASNAYHRSQRPSSPKHQAEYLTYSSIHQISKYCNRVSFEVLKQSSPRLLKGLPSKEESLEEAYWDN